MKFSRNIWKLIKKVFETLVNVAPFIMIFTTLLSGIFNSTKIYAIIYPFLPDSIGYSILADLVMVKLYFRNSFCFPTKIAVTGLIIMNLIGLFYAFYGGSTYETFNFIFDLYIIIIGFLVTITYYLYRWI